VGPLCKSFVMPLRTPKSAPAPEAKGDRGDA
jgi:hypothetical protein